jgi:tetraacyldisaccharide 4'-kinase
MLAWERFSVQAVILDDGYQQLGLVKDLNILLINWRSSSQELRLLPLGGLREPLSQARRADVVLYTMCPEGGGGRPPLAPPGDVPAFRSRHVVTGLMRLADQSPLPLKEAEGKSALAFCGIARPGSFLDTLREAGVSPVDFVTYPDHHHFTSGDLAELAERAARAGAEMIITTEKDAVKIETHAGGTPPFYALTVELTLLDNADEWEWYLTGGIEG